MTNESTVIASQPEKPRRALNWPWALLLIAALIFGAYFRFVGLDWDQGTHRHPDERFLTDVTTRISLPASLGEYFDSAKSSLNPYNHDFGLFVYGNLPVMLTRFTAEALDQACAASPNACLKNSYGVPIGYTAYDGVYLLGRFVSGVLDLFTLIFMFLIGRRLYSVRVGAVAALLGAATVLQIQQSHFYTADIFAAFFATAAVFFVLRFADTNSWGDAVASGIATGLAIACRINVAPLLGVSAIGAFAYVLRQRRQPNRTANFEGAIARIIVATIAAAVVFRIFMPYAFDGLFKFDERWTNNMTYIRSLVSTGDDPGGPPGVQWTNRPPIVFSWINIVFWGLGVPLGLAAWIGWAWAAWQTFLSPYLKRRSGTLIEWLTEVAKSRHLLIWVWVTAYFLWQSTQWVKSIRYQLPIYPLLVMFAAALVVTLWDKARGALTRKSIWRLVSIVSTIVVIGGAYAWAIAFTEIYRKPNTHVAATEWIYANVPAVATLQMQVDGAKQSSPVPFPNTTVLQPGINPAVAGFKVEQAGTLQAITLNRVVDLSGDTGPETLRMSIGETPDPNSALASVEVTASIEPAGTRSSSIEFRFNPIDLQTDRTYFVTLELINGGVLQAQSSTLGVETWDEPIPVGLGRFDAFGIYHGFNIERAWEDNVDKFEHLITALNQTDYIILVSNRAYATQPRQPQRYPMSTEFYRLLFTGGFGFKLVNETVSYPTLGPFTFPDQETTEAMGLWPDPTRCPQSGLPSCPNLINVPMPPAEEAFSVYDHMRVLIFQKTDAYSEADARARLGRIDLSQALQGQSPKSTADTSNDLMLKDSVWQRQQQSGTWSDLFDPNGLLNQAPLLGALVWYLLIALLGFAAFPLLFAITPGLRDRGYGVARMSGLLLVSFAVWFTSSFGLIDYSRGAIAITLLALIVIGVVGARRQRGALQAFWRERRRTILIEEALFGVAFLFFLFVRFGNPDLWHPYMGGEKPMDFAYLNAVLKSNTFPPYDPWFAGGQITYYYFGFVLIATPIKLLGIVPGIAYNFAIPTLFAMTALGAFTAAYNLMWSRARRNVDTDASAHERRWTLCNPMVVGGIAAVFVTFMGNLGTTQMLTEQIAQQIVPDMTFKSSIPGVELIVKTTAGLGKMVFEGKTLNYRPEWWYFTPTREIPAPPGEAGPISEFPFFTFLYADLHAHMIALPLTLLMLVLAIGWLARPPTWSWSGVGAIALGGLVAGALRATNTWDYPTYLLLGSAALLFGTFALERVNALAAWINFWARVIGFIGLSIVFFIPFTRSYATAYSSADVWEGSLTPVWAYLNIHILFLFPIVTFMLWELRRWGLRWWRGMLNTVWKREWWLFVSGAVIVLVVGVLLFRGGREIILVAGPVLLLIAALIIRPRLMAAQRFWLFSVAVAIGLTFAVEVVVLKGDISRMNTTFKFYLQVWVLLGISAAVALGWLADRLAQWRGWGKTLWSGFMWLLVGAAFLYVPLAARGKMLDRYVPDMPPGFDGQVYMLGASYADNDREYPLKWDYDLIRWMQQNVQGTPVVAEGQTGLYRWQSRISINTGLPTIIGWDWHQTQQRSSLPGQLIQWRLQDVRSLYESLDPNEARRVINEYGVKYIVVGEMERAAYDSLGLSKFDGMVDLDVLRVAYRNAGATLYEVVR